MNSKKIIFFVIIAAIILGTVWYFFIRLDKKRAVKTILKYDNNASIDALNAMGEDYLIARAKAYLISETDFEFEGKKYSTESGKTI